MQNKRMSIVLIAVLIVMILAVTLTACSGGNNDDPTPSPDEHIHTFESGWTSDANEHWHKATCEHSEEKSAVAAHEDKNSDCKCDECDRELPHVNVNSDHTCDVCGAHLPDHVYSSDWSKNDTEHWHSPICGDTIVAKDRAPHDWDSGTTTPATCTEDGSTVYTCLTCLAKKTVVIPSTGHSYESEWSANVEGHYHKALCGHEDKDFAPHVDEDGDEECDICHYHDHKFEEAWTVNEDEHYHKATCTTHGYERGDEEEHDFSSGDEPNTCKCGVKEIEVKVFKKFQQHPDYDNSEFSEYMARLKAEGVVDFKLSEMGDIVYCYQDGSEKLAYLGMRTVTAKAIDTTSNGDPLADIWMMVAMEVLATGDEGRQDFITYSNEDGTTALGIGKTGADGSVEITFNPVGGYTSQELRYVLRLAEAKDIAVYMEIDETEAYAMPNRYVSDDMIHTVFDVKEDEELDGLLGTFGFSYSQSWHAYRTIELPYKRYSSNPANPGDSHTQIIEIGKSYSFTTSGGGLFDYMTFMPFFVPKGFELYKYQGTQLETVSSSLKKAASGIYTISFSADNDAQVSLYAWNLGMVSFEGVFEEKDDGSPADKYVNSVSGTAPVDSSIAGKYTGGNYVVQRISTGYADQGFQFGIKTNKECKVTITIERSDYVEVKEPDFEFVSDGNGGWKVDKACWYELGWDHWTISHLVYFDLSKLEPGAYLFKVTPSDCEENANKSSSTNGSIVIDLGNKDRRSALMHGSAYIQIKEGDTLLELYDESYYMRNDTAAAYLDIKLTRYEPSAFTKDDEAQKVFVRPNKWSESENIVYDLDLAEGTYTLSAFISSATQWSEASNSIMVKIGTKEFELKHKSEGRYEGQITVGAADKTITFYAKNELGKFFGVFANVTFVEPAQEASSAAVMTDSPQKIDIATDKSKYSLCI